MKKGVKIEEQIRELKDRGLIIKNEEKAKEVLADIGFYRLGFYLFPFEKSYPAKHGRDHVLRPGVSLDTILRLYYFDFELRHILLKYISRIEIHLRTTIVNYMSSKHHNHSCKYAPAWKTLEFMTFGEIIDLLFALNSIKDRLEICHHFDVHSLNTFASYLNAVRRIRNRCAHGGVLYDYSASKRLVAKGPVKLDNVYDRFDLKGSIDVILYLLSKVSFHRKEEMTQELMSLIDKTKTDKLLYKAICIASGLQ